jgi:alpha-tubulin suppressor-like RCC1 family protein
MDGKVFCWGCPIKNTTTACSAANAITSPTPVGNFSDAIQVKVGGTYACVLRGTGDVQCFGADNNSKGLLGDGTANGSDAPVFVHNLDNAIALSVSSDHACAVRAGGFVQCWGDNAFGQLGNGGSGHAATPVTAMAGSPWAVAVATGTGTSMAVTSDGSLFFWGNGNNGDGNGAPTTHRTPNQVSGVLEAVDVAAGDDAQCYLNAHGHVKCWGLNTFGERGDNTIGGPTTYLPNLVVNSAGDEVSDMVSLSGSSETFCGASGLGHIACWGHSNHGQAGNGTTSDQPSGIVAAGF